MALRKMFIPKGRFTTADPELRIKRQPDSGKVTGSQFNAPAVGILRDASLYNSNFDVFENETDDVYLIAAQKGEQKLLGKSSGAALSRNVSQAIYQKTGAVRYEVTSTRAGTVILRPIREPESK